MSSQIRTDPSALADANAHNGLHELIEDLAYQRLAIVNVVMFGPRNAPDRGWVLIDAGLMAAAPVVEHAARDRFGDGSRPSAIILTHGHFDHVGALRVLAERWDCPIYAHAAELPFLDGRESYPPPDPAAGGLMSVLSAIFPRGPLEVGDRLLVLPSDGTVPDMPGWEWIHTPGHTPGHISLWRAADRTLIAGDAFITTEQESVYAAAMQTPEVHGPPQYFTPDWASAETSVRTLAALEPELAITGHGRALRGPILRRALHALADDFARIAVPESARNPADEVRHRR